MLLDGFQIKLSSCLFVFFNKTTLLDNVGSGLLVTTALVIIDANQYTINPLDSPPSQTT